MPTLTKNLFYGHGEGEHELTVTGRWPDDIGGTVAIIGPDRAKPGGHWFNGQGILCRIDCEPRPSGHIQVDFRRIETPLSQIRDRLPRLFRRNGIQETSPFGFSNFANTNVQTLGDRMFIGYDAGRPIEVDPESLETITPIGANSEWLQTLPAPVEPMIAVAAHPGAAWDEAALYFANYELIPLSGRNDIRICRYALDGNLEHWVLEGVAAFDSIHDVKVTRDYVVITDLPFVIEPFGPDPEKGRRPVASRTQVWIVSKADLARRAPGSSVPFRHLTIPMMSGHLSVDYDNRGREIIVHLAHHPSVDLPLAIVPGDRRHCDGAPFDPDYEGLIPVGNQPNGIGRYVIDADAGKLLDGRVAVDVERFWGGTLFTQNLANEGSRNHVQNLWVAAVGFDPELVSERWWRTYSEQTENVFVAPRDFPDEPVPGGLARFDLDRMEIADRYAYADGSFPHPATFVPRRDARHDTDGYIVAPVHRDGDKELHVFDAAKLADGPVARATAPGFNPPLLLHSWWAQKRQGPRPSRYSVDPERDAWETLQAFADAPAASLGIARSLFESAGEG